MTLAFQNHVISSIIWSLYQLQHQQLIGIIVVEFGASDRKFVEEVEIKSGQNQWKTSLDFGN